MTIERTCFVIVFLVLQKSWTKKVSLYFSSSLWFCLLHVVNFINVLQAAFTLTDPKSAKKTDNLTVFFALLGSSGAKAACKMLEKLAKRCQFYQHFMPDFCAIIFVPKNYRAKT